MHFVRIPEEVISGIYIGCRADGAKEMKNTEIIENFQTAKESNPKLAHVKLYESVLDETDYRIRCNEIAFWENSMTASSAMCEFRSGLVCKRSECFLQRIAKRHPSNR